MPSEPGLLAEAFSAFRRRAGALFAAAALALGPASILANGVVYVAKRSTHAEAAPRREEQIASRDRALERMPPDQARQDLLRDPNEAGALRVRALPSAMFAASVALAAFFFSLGILVAQGAVFPLAFGDCAGATLLAARWGALWKTALLAATLVGLGLLFVVPGVVLAVAFSLAAPVAMAEGLEGAAALSRSARLVRRAWPEMFALIVLPAGAIVAIEEGFRRALELHDLVARAVLHAGVSAVVLPFPLVLSVFVYLRARSEVDGTPLEELRQYMRRISAPG